MPYESINEDQHSCLRMLCTLHISINSHSPSLITTSIPIRILSIDEGGEFGPEEEDVYATESRDLIEMFHHVCLESSLSCVDDELSINIHDRTSL